MIRFFRKRDREASAFASLTNRSELDAALAASQERPVLLYKHSSICGASSWARNDLLDLTKHDDPPVFELVIQKARRLSHEIAELWDIRHESPQALLVSEGRVLWHGSHGSVRAESVREAMKHYNE